LADGVGYRQVPFYLSDDEFVAMMLALNQALLPYLGNQPAPNRRRRLFTTIVFPDTASQDASRDVGPVTNAPGGLACMPGPGTAQSRRTCRRNRYARPEWPHGRASAPPPLLVVLLVLVVSTTCLCGWCCTSSRTSTSLSGACPAATRTSGRSSASLAASLAAS